MTQILCPTIAPEGVKPQVVACILDSLLADLTKMRVNRRVILVRREAMEYAPRPELLPELRILWIVRILRLFFGIEVVEVSEELVKAMEGWKKLIPIITQMVLPELPGRITKAA
jgi:hypothetical protein